MTSFTLSTTTQNAINYALANGPGTHNANYLSAYTDIYNDLVANGSVDPAVLYWFSQAGSINSAQYSSTPSAAAVYIWNYTQGAAASEGVTVTTKELQDASDDIAHSVFQNLKGSNFVFNDAGNFSPTNIVATDASQAIDALQKDFPGAGLDWAIWGGTLFAQTTLGDTTFIADHNIDLTPGSRDATAMLAGLFSAAAAATAAGYTFTLTGISTGLGMDLPTINTVSGSALSTGLTWTIASGAVTGALAAGVNYIVNTSIGKVITISSSGSSAPGTAVAYEPTNNGTLSFDEGTAGSGTLTLTNGTVVSVGGTADLAVTGIDSGSATDEAALLAYLSYIGDPLTSSQLDTDNYNYQNPTGSAYTVTGTVSGSNDNFTDNGGAAGAVITGVSGKTNILTAYGDLTRDTITNIQELNLNGGTTLTAAEFAGFSSIIGSGGLTISTAGTVSIAGLSATISSLAAQDWGGTTLTGNGTSGQTLTASLFGNDTLTAGNGTGDALAAGGGVDTITGGTGGDTFGAADGLAAGSSLTGHGTGNSLTLSGTDVDISGATITGIQSLFLAAEIELTCSGGELSGFSTISGGGDEAVTIVANGSGTYSMADFTSPGDVIMFADPTANTSLTGGSGGSTVNMLEADDTSGNNTLTTGSTQLSTLTAEDSSGNNTLTAGNAFRSVLDVSGSTGNNSLTVNDTTGVSGIGVNKLSAADSSGNNTLTVSNASDDTLDVSGSTGTDTLTAGSGSGDVFYAGLGDDTLNGGTGSNESFYFTGKAGAGTTVTGGSGGSNALYAETADISAASVSGVTQLQDDSASLTLSGSAFNQFTTLVNNYGAGATLVIVGSGSYSLTGKTVTGSAFTLITDSGTTITGNNLNGQALYANSTGTSTVNAGSGTADFLYAGSGTDTLNAGSGGDTLVAGSGTDTLTGGSGNDTLVVGNALASGDTLNGGTGTNGIQITAANASIASATISNITSLEIENGASTTLTLSQFNALSTYTADPGAGNVALSGAGTYSLSSKAVSGALTLDASASSGNFTLTGSSAANETLDGSTGTDTITTGSGAVEDVNTHGTNDVVTSNGGTNSWINANGTGDNVTLDGTLTTVVSNASGQTITSSANAETLDLYSTSATATVSGINTWAFMTGNSNTLTTNSGSMSRAE